MPQAAGVYTVPQAAGVYTVPQAAGVYTVPQAAGVYAVPQAYNFVSGRKKRHIVGRKGTAARKNCHYILRDVYTRHSVIFTTYRVCWKEQIQHYTNTVQVTLS